MTLNRRAFILLSIATACASLANPNAYPLWGGLTPGRYAVGFRSPNEWYPGGGDGDHLRYRDYAGELDKLEASLHEQRMSDQAIVDLFDSPMFARRDASPVNETFPVVYIVMRNNQTAADLAVIGEYLASHGYVVRAVDASTKADPNAQWLHDVRVSALTSPAQVQSVAKTLLHYLDSHRTR